MEADLGGMFSVALSIASRHLGVTQRYALPSSDFPPAPLGTQAATRLTPPISYLITIEGLVCKPVCLEVLLARNV